MKTNDIIKAWQSDSKWAKWKASAVTDVHLFFVTLWARIKFAVRGPSPVTLDDLYLLFYSRECRLMKFRAMRSNPAHPGGEVLDQLIAKEIELVNQARDKIDARLNLLKRIHEDREKAMSAEND